MNITAARSMTAVHRPQASRPSQVEQEDSLVDKFVDNIGFELATGAAMTVFTALPVLGAVGSWNGANDILAPPERKTAFEAVSALSLYGAAASNVAGVAALCSGHGALGLGLLAGAGIVGGINAALLMDGGSLASRLGLQP